MKICITGASGFIGQSLIQSFKEKGYECVYVKRKLLYEADNELTEILSGSDAVINLAGAPIMQRWTEANKKTIYSSRVDTTANLTEAIRKIATDKRPKIFISASAVGIYRAGDTHDETSTRVDPGFVGQVVTDWEKASKELPKSVRRVIFRIGVVLGKDSQTMKKLLPLFRLGLGGKIGSGKQAFSFIHIHDLVAAFNEALSNSKFEGTYNLVAPDLISYADFTRALSKSLKRPAFFPVPAFAIRLIFGKTSELILEGPTVIPKRLQEENFKYRYPTLLAAMEEIAKN
ncbi:TIGR01777 family oxidoreductase [Mangrovibacterium lignilyticum]|uniref:TIGR01777 family oxidoreductase n=1 Tax=Mangrovibacterium lignilyticum TaxID=2668052 RepID=UPI0013D7E5B8|nr:TIGR01777 family oxidoreductase [Mangrovibacterium lignilyticum]